MRDRPPGAGVRDHLLLLGRFLRHPRTVGAVAPSSRTMAEAMIEHIDFTRPVTIVELGPGTGAFTALIVERLQPHGRFLAVEVDPAFCLGIRARWPSVECVCASAERLDTIAAERDLLPVDHIVSGLPFVSLPGTITNTVLDRIAAVLRPGGTFTTFQYVHGYAFPPAIKFRDGMCRRMGGGARSHLVIPNIPPAFVLTWEKSSTTL